MFEKFRATGAAWWGAMRRLPVPLFVLAIIGIFAVTIGGAVWGYRTWDYVEHDNEFCMSCHLMLDPYEQFAESEHRGLGCKACHQPSLIQRSQMGLAQIIANPDSIRAHAEVPNERCMDCHVEGDPEKWNLIARSRGHRIHFESNDSTLDGLMCVECHSTSVHQFAPSDETCGQSACHTDSDIKLGTMSETMIHCAACHAFSAPLESVAIDAPLEPTPEGGLEGVLRPSSGECLTCHVMRTLVDLPEDDPHKEACGACHNPHTQETPAEAVESCATAACHSDVETNPFHVVLETETLDACLDCHVAHDFHAESQDCIACHEDIFDDARIGLAPSGYRQPVSGSDESTDREGSGLTGATAIHALGLTAVGSALAHPVTALGIGMPAVQPVVGVKPDSVFRHAQHRDVDCMSCHAMEPSHGAVTVTSTMDCRQCHHTAPESQSCASCHQDSGVEGQTFFHTASLTLSVTDGEEVRDLPFEHAPHADLDCAECHTDGLMLGATALDCSSCHEEHHAQGVSCMDCHTPTRQDKHEVEAHVGCGGAGCHEDVPFEGVPRDRNFCLVCHQNEVDHRPEEPRCVECHALPAPGSVAG
jgi:nitrate/TMAO reductase-like tetraheme cytochrome c subunit